MENIVLENAALRVEVNPKGAELRSFFKKDSGKEQLWHGDPAIWADRSPWLFPMIGQLRNNVYFAKGGTYTMPMHGFASKSVFCCEQLSATEASFTLEATEETLFMLPWRFVLCIVYRLKESCLQIDCSVHCLDREDMYFSFGAHPGFLCQPGDIVTFTDDEALTCQRLEAGSHLLLPDVETIAPTVTLKEELFDDDAMLLRAPQSQTAVLRRADGTGIRFSYGKAAWVGLWSRKRAGLPYICIEPWHGVDDPVDATGKLEEKLDIVHLPAGETFTMQLCIEPF